MFNISNNSNKYFNIGQNIDNSKSKLNSKNKRNLSALNNNNNSSNQLLTNKNNNFNQRIENSLNRRKENLNKFINLYRLKNLNTSSEMKNNLGYNNKIEDNSNINKSKDKEIIGKSIIDNNNVKISNNNYIHNNINDKDNNDENISHKNDKINQDLDLNNEDDLYNDFNSIKENKSNEANMNYNLKKLYIEQIFQIKFTSKNYEIDNSIFEEIDIEKAGNCFYCCLSYYKYKSQKNHLEIRNKIYDFIRQNKELFYTYFEDNINQFKNNLNIDIQ